MFKVLIIDDTRSVHAFVKTLLAKAGGIEVTSAMNGEDGVAKIKGSGPFDLILLDWEMPVLNGPDTFDRLKAMGGAPPVMMMTTKNEPADIERMLSAGVAEYLMKPFTVDILFEKIEFVTGKAFKHAA